MLNLTERIYKKNGTQTQQRKYDCVWYNNSRRLNLTCAKCVGATVNDCKVIYKPCLLESGQANCLEFKKGKV